MRQPRPVQIAFVVDEDLGLVHQSAERGRMYDAVAITLIFRTVSGCRFRVAAPAGMFVESRIRGESAHAKNSLSVASSADCGYSAVTMARPSFSISTKRSVPASTFLS